MTWIRGFHTIALRSWFFGRSWSVPHGISWGIDRSLFVVLFALAATRTFATNDVPQNEHWGELTGIALLSALIIRELFRYLRDRDHVNQRPLPDSSHYERIAALEGRFVERGVVLEKLQSDLERMATGVPHLLYERIAALESRVDERRPLVQKLQMSLDRLSVRVDRLVQGRKDLVEGDET